MTDEDRYEEIAVALRTIPDARVRLPASVAWADTIAELARLRAENAALREHASTDGWTRVRISAVQADQDELSRLQAENAKLRAALARVRQGYLNILDLRVQRIDGRAHLTREEITEELQRVEAALRPPDATPAPNPSPDPAESATGHESAGNGGVA